MPELPEVETVRRGLESTLSGHRIHAVTVRRRMLRLPVPPDFESRVAGRHIAGFGRRAKYLLWHLDSGDVILAHLGMSGRMIVGAGPLPSLGRHDHLTFTFAHGAHLIFSDVRRFGLMTITEEEHLTAHPLLSALGPEPLSNQFSAAYLEKVAAQRRQPLKAFLLDQRNVAGVGNIYASEALHRARLSPRRLAGSLPGVRAPRLTQAVREVLQDAIESGGSTLRDYVRSDGELGYFQHRFAVYDCEGKSCPRNGCGGVIRRIVQSGRSTFYCPACQR